MLRLEQNKLRSSRKLFWEKHYVVGLQDCYILEIITISKNEKTNYDDHDDEINTN